MIIGSTRSFAFAVACAGVCMGCGTKPDTKTPPPPDGPKWVHFNAPLGAVELPAFMVGEQGQLSSGCWEKAETKEVTSADALTWEKSAHASIEAGVQATFEKYLIKAGLDASLAKSSTNTWSLSADGLSVDTVDPANARPNFKNQACTAKDLEWFEAGRFVVTQALRAKKMKLKASSGVSKDVKTKLDAAVSMINAEFHTKFSSASDTSDALAIDGTDVYFGGMGTALVVTECSNDKPVAIQPDKALDLCGGRYSVVVKLSAVPSEYTLVVSPSDGDTAEFAETFGVQKARAIDGLRLLRAMVRKEADGLQASKISILTVGAHAR